MLAFCPGVIKQHALVAFRAVVQLLKLAVEHVPAQVPEQVVVPVSVQLPGLAVQCN